MLKCPKCDESTKLFKDDFELYLHLTCYHKLSPEVAKEYIDNAEEETRLTE